MGKIFYDCSPGIPTEIGEPAISCFGFTWFDRELFAAGTPAGDTRPINRG
jgi:hypothetical protein